MTTEPRAVTAETLAAALTDVLYRQTNDGADPLPEIEDYYEFIAVQVLSALSAPHPDPEPREALREIADATPRRSTCPTPGDCMYPQHHSDDESSGAFAGRLQQIARAALRVEPSSIDVERHHKNDDCGLGTRTDADPVHALGVLRERHANIEGRDPANGSPMRMCANDHEAWPCQTVEAIDVAARLTQEATRAERAQSWQDPEHGRGTE